MYLNVLWVDLSAFILFTDNTYFSRVTKFGQAFTLGKYARFVLDLLYRAWSMEYIVLPDFSVSIRQILPGIGRIRNFGGVCEPKGTGNSGFLYDPCNEDERRWWNWCSGHPIELWTWKYCPVSIPSLLTTMWVHRGRFRCTGVRCTDQMKYNRWLPASVWHWEHKHYRQVNFHCHHDFFDLGRCVFYFFARANLFSLGGLTNKNRVSVTGLRRISVGEMILRIRGILWYCNTSRCEPEARLSGYNDTLFRFPRKNELHMTFCHGRNKSFWKQVFRLLYGK